MEQGAAGLKAIPKCFAALIETISWPGEKMTRRLAMGEVGPMRDEGKFAAVVALRVRVQSPWICSTNARTSRS